MWLFFLCQEVSSPNFYGKKGSPERPEIIFKSLRTMENVGVNAAGHLVSDGLYTLKGGIALVVAAQPDLAGATAHYNKNGHCRRSNDYECDDSARLLSALGMQLFAEHAVLPMLGSDNRFHYLNALLPAPPAPEGISQRPPEAFSS